MLRIASYSETATDYSSYNCNTRTDFSVMRRLKTYLRSSMTQERLNNVLILHCYKSRTDVIEVASLLVNTNERRLHFFGIFLFMWSLYYNSNSNSTPPVYKAFLRQSI